MSLFSPDPQAFFTDVYRDTAPWDVGAAQPALDAVLTDYPPAGPVLDVGCGTGDLAIALAARGLSVLGVDFIEAAIAEARARASRQPPAVQHRLEFRVADALSPSTLEPSASGPPFSAVVDSGFFHLFEDADRDAFALDLARALRSGGRYYLLGFAVTLPGMQFPRAVEDAELRRRFSPAAGWRLLHCEPATFASRMGPVPAVVACFERPGSTTDVPR